MGLIEEILNYYSFYSLHEIHKGEYQSVQDCMDHLTKKGAELQLRTFLGIVKKFENEGFPFAPVRGTRNVRFVLRPSGVSHKFYS